MISVSRLSRASSDFLSTAFADRNFVTFLVLMFINGVVFGPFMPFLPVYVQDNLGRGQEFTATFRTLSLFMMAAFVLLGGVASDSIGPKKAVILGLVGTPAAAIAFMTNNTTGLLLIAVYKGISEGFLNGGGQTYLVESAPAKRLALATGVFFMGNTLGAGAGSAIGGVILEATSFANLGFVMLIGSVPILLAFWFLLKDIKPPSQRQLNPIEVLKGYWEIAGRRYVWSLSLMQYLRTTFWGAASIAMPFLMFQLTGSKSMVGWFTMASLIAGMASMMIVGAISDRVGRKRIVLGSVAAIGVSSLLLALSVENAAALFASGVIATTAAWTLSGQMTPLSKEIAEPGEAGRLVGMILFPWALAMLTGAWLHGLLTETHPRLMFLIAAGLLVAAFGFGMYVFHARAKVAAETAQSS